MKDKAAVLSIVQAILSLRTPNERDGGLVLADGDDAFRIVERVEEILASSEEAIPDAGSTPLERAYHLGYSDGESGFDFVPSLIEHRVRALEVEGSRAAGSGDGTGTGV